MTDKRFYLRAHNVKILLLWQNLRLLIPSIDRFKVTTFSPTRLNRPSLTGEIRIGYLISVKWPKQELVIVN